MKTFKDSYQYILGSVVCIGFFWLIVVLARKDIPENNSSLLNITVGALIGSFNLVVGYFFGSSKGSSDKNDMLANSVPK